MYLKKINFCLEKNTEYQKFVLYEKYISSIISYALLTSCDVERSFPKYKSIL